MLIAYINNASKIRGTEIIVKKGSIVHTSCRKTYTNKYYLQVIEERKASDSYISIPSLRSKATPGFKYSTHCILCESIVINANGEKHNDVYRVSSWNCQNSFKTCCESRGDDWADKVKLRLVVADDLPANDVLYHHQCNTKFRI